MKRIIGTTLLIIFACCMASDMSAQRKSRKRTNRTERSTRTDRSRSETNRDDTETISIRDRMAYDILIGNIGLGQGFSLSGKVGAGYKVIERITGGLGAKFYYFYQNLNGPNNISTFSYGLFPYARFKITEQIYFKGEYVYYTIDGGNGDNAKPFVPFLGGGYSSGFGPWKFGIELMLIVKDRDRDRYFQGDLFEYTIGATYNF